MKVGRRSRCQRLLISLPVVWGVVDLSLLPLRIRAIVALDVGEQLVVAVGAPGCNP